MGLVPNSNIIIPTILFVIIFTILFLLFKDNFFCKKLEEDCKKNEDCCFNRDIQYNCINNKCRTCINIYNVYLDDEYPSLTSSEKIVFIDELKQQVSDKLGIDKSR